MANDLADPADLEAFPGAPFAQDIVDGAVASLRLDVGWHIAPEKTETVVLDGSSTTVLTLPTRRLVDVTEIRDVGGASPVVLTGWRPNKKAGLLHRFYGWPTGFQVIEVDMVHGYATTPTELYAVIAERCQDALVNATVRQETAGGESISFSVSGAMSLGSAKVIDHFTVHSGF